MVTSNSVINPTTIPTIGPKINPVILTMIPSKATRIGGKTVMGIVKEITIVIETEMAVNIVM